MSNSPRLKEDFHLRVGIRQGPGVLRELPGFLREHGLTRPAVVVDRNIRELPQIRSLLEALSEDDGIELTVFQYDLPFEPTYEALEQHRGRFSTNGYPAVDVFIGIGGGSAMDFAKGLATLATNPGPALQYRGFPVHLNPSLPNITVPTTAGSGAEVTFNAVFIEEATKRKLGINTWYNSPLVSFVDLDVARLCPLAVTLNSGLDALVHIIEGFASRKCGVLSRALFLEAFTIVFNTLPRLMKDPQNLELRSKMFVGSHIGAFGLQNAGGGPAGVISNHLGSQHRVPHGIAGGMILAHAIRHNVESGYTGYADLYGRIEGTDASLSRERKAQQFVDSMFWLYETCGVPQDLAQYGLTSENVPRFVALFTEGDFAQNPAPFGPEDVERIISRLTH